MSKARKAVQPRKGRRAARLRVFISHTTTDLGAPSDWGDCWLRTASNTGLVVSILCTVKIGYGGIGGALQKCNWLLIVGSPAATRNRWVRDEVTYALVERRYRNRVVPLLFENCNLRQLAWSLQSIQYIDFRRGWRPGSEQLVTRILGRRPRNRKPRR